MTHVLHEIVHRLDEIGRPAWLTAMIMGFILWWPVGLSLLLFLGLSGRFRAWRVERAGRWAMAGGAPWGGCGAKSAGFGWRGFGAATSGNAAFDEYRGETLRRLEDEQKEFVEFLARLRKARDKAEFDQFMAERRNRPAPTPPTETEAA